MMQDVESFIRNHVRKILLESRPSSEGDVTVARGRVGRGSFSRATKLNGSLADREPEKLIEKLGLSNFNLTGDTAEEKIFSLIRRAVTSSNVMKEAYVDVKMMQGDDIGDFIRITPAESLRPRDATQYMFLVLIAANKTGKLRGIGKNVTAGLDPDGYPGIFFETRR